MININNIKWEDLSKDEQNFFLNFLYTVFAKVEEINGEFPLICSELMAYKVFLKDVFEHLNNNEMFNVDFKKWEIIKQ